jgi:Ran-binding protein 3
MAYANINPFMSPKKPSNSESGKRPREDADEDANPRDPKRPSPPPDKKPIEDSNPTNSGGGFLAFASKTSSFASVKGPNVFGSSSTKTTAPPSPSPTPWSSGVRTPLTPSHDQTRPVFGSTSSPYVRPGSPGPAFGRSNSPSPRKVHTVGGVNKNTNAFSAYATSSFSGFSPAPKKTKALEENKKKRGGSSDGSGKSDDEEGSEEKESMSFGERLRSQKDDQGSGEDEKPALTEQEGMSIRSAYSFRM